MQGAEARSVDFTYFVKDDYKARSEPDYFVDADDDDGLICQPDVYGDACLIAAAFGSKRIIDIGSGNGLKLSTMYPQFEITGIDFGENLETCRARYPFGTWLEHNLDIDEPLPVSPDDLENAVIVCADVIEHLVRPELLLRKLRAALDSCDAILISTPERDLTWGIHHQGPPPNPHHVREWNMEELLAFLQSEGFEHGELGLTRNNNRHNELNNILAVLVSSSDDADLVNRLQFAAAHIRSAM